jgi:hypothetical protein
MLPHLPMPVVDDQYGLRYYPGIATDECGNSHLIG